MSALNVSAEALTNHHRLASEEMAHVVAGKRAGKKLIEFRSQAMMTFTGAACVF
jgi:hypothetical protein